MPYARYTLTGGLNTKAEPASLADGQLTVAIGCSYDTIGAVTSARGRLVLNDGVALAGDTSAQDIRGHFDAFGKRYTKSGTSVYQDYSTLVGANASWTGDAKLTGFGYGAYVYLCDGGVIGRYNDATDTLESWGLAAPGYQELGANPLATTTSTTVTVTTPAAHGLTTGMTVEHYGLLATNGIPASELNGQKTVTVVTTTTYTFTTTTSGASVGVSGGGSAAYIKQGPTLTLVTDGSISNTSDPTYRYAYTFYNGMAESNFSALIAATLLSGSGHDSVALTNILAGPTGTTERRIYRTDRNGQQLYFLYAIPDNTTTTYTDRDRLPPTAAGTAAPGDAVTDEAREAGDNDSLNSNKKKGKQDGFVSRGRFYDRLRRTSENLVAPEVVATNLGLQADWTDHDAPPSDLEGVIIVNDQVVGISGNEVRFSSVGNPEHWPITNRITPGKAEGETLMCVRAFDRDVIIYTDSGMYRLSQLGTSFEDSRFEVIESPVGTTSKYGVAVLDGQRGHVFVSSTGLYLFDGQRVQEASLAFDSLFDQVNLQTYGFNADYADTAILEALRDRIFMSYGYSSDNDTMLVVDFEDISDPKASIIPRATTTLFRERAGNRLIAGDAGGRLYEMEYGYAEDYYESGGDTFQSPILMLLATKDYLLGNGAPFILDEVLLDCDMAVGADEAPPTLTVEMRARGVSRIATFDVTSTTRSRLKFKCPQTFRGELVRLTLSSTATTQRRVYAVGFTYRPQDEP